MQSVKPTNLFQVSLNFSVLLSTTLFLAAAALAEPSVFQQAQYQYKAELQVDNAQSIQKLRLPEAVQSRLRHSDASDVRVFGPNGEVIPSLVKFLNSEALPELEQALAFYPIFIDDSLMAQRLKNISAADTEVRLELHINAQNVLSKNTTAAGADAEARDKDNNSHSNKEQRPKAYLIENPLYENDVLKPNPSGAVLTQLQLSWKPGFEGIASVKIETSSDLNQWRTLVARDSIATLRFNNRQLRKQTLTIPDEAERFLRLVWNGDQRPLIDGVNATISQRSRQPVFQWSSPLALIPVAEQGAAPNTYEFELGPAFKTDKLRLVGAETNQIYIGAISSRAANRNNWVKRASFQFYRVAANGGEISSLEKALVPNASPFWRIVFEHPQQLDFNNSNGGLALEANRYPLDLYFLRQGSGPFYLAYGKSKPDAQQRMSHVVADLLGQAGDSYGVATVVKTEPVEPWQEPEELTLEDWKQIILWLVLIAGVVLMLWMARGLLRQMAQDQ